MPKFKYDRICITAYEIREFDPRDPRSLRAAIEHLKAMPDAKYTGLIVEAPVRPGKYRLRAPVFMKLDQIIGKTAKQIWDHCDSEIERQIRYFEMR